MESFEIKISHDGSTHTLRVECDSADPEYRIYRGTEPVGIVRPSEEDDLSWESENIQDKEFVEHIGEAIERYHR